MVQNMQRMSGSALWEVMRITALMKMPIWKYATIGTVKDGDVLTQTKTTKTVNLGLDLTYTAQVLVKTKMFVTMDIQSMLEAFFVFFF